MDSISYIKYTFNNINTDILAENMYVGLGDVTLPTDITFDDTAYRNTKRNLIFAKKILTTDTAALISKNSWVANTTYDRYDNISNNNFHVINQNRDVYKCIYNSASTPSTIEPITRGNSLIEESDGYIWKYMFTLTEAEFNKFSTTDFIPIIEDNDIVGNSVSGTIDFVTIDEGNTNFSLYNTGTVQQKLSTQVYKIEDTASSITNAYQNFNVYINNGTGVGTLTNVSTSYANSTGKYITFSSGVSLNVDSEYIISPKVEISDRRGTGFEGYSVIGENEELSQIIVIDPGSDYIKPELSLTTNGTGGDVEVTFLLSPELGHGSDAISELNAKKLMISSNFLLNEHQTLPNNSFTFYRSSLLNNPNTNSPGQNTISYGISADITTTMAVGSLVTGANASGMIYYSNSTHVKINDVIGDFANGEVISDANSVTGTINIIKNKDAETLSGSILYYSTHTNGVEHDQNVSEDIKFILNLESNT
ncbi:MAG: hypothetical protein COA52_00790 [Hyphomicrobiales bacterium]|nr:MAG: hypothetical protein COA52_00790 [Hyphomicrobiales bacterium]